MKKQREYPLQTDTGAAIDKRIAAKKTVLFTNEIAAKNFADNTRSYHYAVFSNGATTGQYAVPL